MFLFLSSGAQERYRQDVLRAIAQPVGSLIQFRYGEELLSAAVLKQVREAPRSLEGKPGLIAFLDRKDNAPAEEPDLVPCRYVTVHQVTRHGSKVTVQLKLGAFPKGREAVIANFIAGFNLEAKQQLTDGYPRWDRNVGGQRVGPHPKATFWSSAKDNWESVSPLPVGANWEEVAAAWETIVKALQPREHFNTEPYFFLFRGIRTVDEGEALTDRRVFVMPDPRGFYSLSPGKEYELLVYHYHPTGSAAGVPPTLKVSASNPVIEFTSGVTFSLDSGYDEKAARFMVGDAPTTTRGVFTITGTRRKDVGGKPEDVETVWFDLPMEVPRDWWWVGVKGALLASPVAFGPAAAALYSKNIEASDRGWIIALCFFGACAGGALTALFGKK